MKAGPVHVKMVIEWHGISVLKRATEARRDFRRVKRSGVDVT
jgi:hypothetical protein